jgi:nucleotide-binding universal stress UspA family protein
MSDRIGSGEPCLVVGYDGSDVGRAAVAYAARRAGSEGKLYVVYAFGSPPNWAGKASRQQFLDEHRGHGQAILDDLVGQAGGPLAGVDYELELMAEDPAEAIAQVGQVRNAEEIVVGSRGAGPVRGALGSVSHKLLHLADRPVTVIPDR